MPRMSKGRKLLDAQPSDLNDSDLDIQLGAITEEIEHIIHELASIDRKAGQLTGRLTKLEAHSGIVKAERSGRRSGNANP